MTWHLTSARETFPAIAAEWDRLNAMLYGSHPLFDSRFIGALLVHFGSGEELLCIHRCSNTIDGALILRPLGLGRWALFLPSQAQAGAVMLKDAALLDTLLQTLPGHAWSLDLLSIDPLYSPDWTHLRLPRIVVPHANTMAVATDGSFHDYWQSRPKKLRDNIRRYQRRAEASAGPLAIFTFIRPDEVADALVRYGKLESAGWKGKEGTAISPDNAQGKFYADMLARFAATGQALVMELHAGKQLVASRLFIRHDRMWIALKTTYDETLSAFAPGRLLLHTVLERAFAEMPSGAVEFYTNASRDQAEWATALRPIPHHQIFRTELIAGLSCFVKTLRHADQNDQDAYDPLTVNHYPNIASIPSSTLEFFQQAADCYPEYSPSWFDNLQHAVFSDDPGVSYYTAEFASQPVVILPVRLIRYGRIRCIEAFSNYYTSLFSPILCPNASEIYLAGLLKTASREHGNAHEMRFAPMDPDSPAFVALIAALRSIGWIPFRYYRFGNWYQSITQSWEDYLAARPGELRSTIKRKSRKFAAEGGTLEIVTGLSGIEAAIEAYTHVYARSWKKPEPYPEFIPGLIRLLAAKGWLRLGIARMQKLPIASQIWIVANRKAYIFKLAYDENYAQYAPGTLLTAHLMKHIIDHDGVREVDYLIGDDEYKKQWMSERRERWGIIAYNPASIIGLSLLGKKIMGRNLRTIRKSYESLKAMQADTMVKS